MKMLSFATFFPSLLLTQFATAFVFLCSRRAILLPYILFIFHALIVLTLLGVGIAVKLGKRSNTALQYRLGTACVFSMFMGIVLSMLAFGLYYNNSTIIQFHFASTLCLVASILYVRYGPPPEELL